MGYVSTYGDAHVAYFNGGFAERQDVHQFLKTLDLRLHGTELSSRNVRLWRPTQLRFGSFVIAFAIPIRPVVFVRGPAAWRLGCDPTAQNQGSDEPER